MIKIKITGNIYDIKSTNNEIKEVRYNDDVVWGDSEVIVKITFSDIRNLNFRPNSVYVYLDDPKNKGLQFKQGETRDIKPVLKNGKNYIKIETTGAIMNSSLIIKEKNGSWQKSLVTKDEIIINNTVFEIELVNASNNKEYIIEFNK